MKDSGGGRKWGIKRYNENVRQVIEGIGVGSHTAATCREGKGGCEGCAKECEYEGS